MLPLSATVPSFMAWYHPLMGTDRKRGHSVTGGAAFGAQPAAAGARGIDVQGDIALYRVSSEALVRGGLAVPQAAGGYHVELGR